MGRAVTEKVKRLELRKRSSDKISWLSGSGSFLLLGVSPKPPLLVHRFHLGAAGQQDRSSGGMLVAAQKCRTRHDALGTYMLYGIRILASHSSRAVCDIRNLRVSQGLVNARL